jgi:hypothetical protein
VTIRYPEENEYMPLTVFAQPIVVQIRFGRGSNFMIALQLDRGSFTMPTLLQDEDSCAVLN